MGSTSPALVIVLGNEKGGVGKSTIAVNLVIGLARQGLSVATMDVDGRQRTMTRWLKARGAASERAGVALEMPAHAAITASVHDSVSLNEERDFAAVAAAIERLDGLSDLIVIDTPAGDSYLGRLAHSLADIVITPVQESPVDLDALVHGGDPGVGGYRRMVADAREARAATGDVAVDWIVVTNRRQPRPAPVTPFAAVLEELGATPGCRVVYGPCERAVYRDLFAEGLSVFDAAPAGSRRGPGPVSARVAACQEIESLIAALYLPFPTGVARHGTGTG